MPDTQPAATAPTARQKRDMAAVTHAESVVRIPGTPYVVLSFDGPVDLTRLAEALGTGIPQHEAAQAPTETWADPGELGFVTDLPDPGDPDPALTDDDPDPEALILAYLRERGPADPKTIAAATGLTRIDTGVHLVHLSAGGRVAKNGLAYAATT